MEIKIREFKEEDTNFILTTWSKSYYAHLSERPPKAIYYKFHIEQIKNILKSSTCLVAVAHDDDSQIVGYCVFNSDKENCLHYIYVKTVFRQMGFATELLKILGQDFQISHYTAACKLLKTNRKMVFNPYRFYFIQGKI